ncbi:MAG: N-acetylmuramic acid 6-phosphate etherase [Bacteroidota bacterium]
MDKKKTTERPSVYDNLEKMDVLEILQSINTEDKKVAGAVEKCISQIHPLVNKASELMKEGGRLFYVGSGTSGRLGIVDASECPPTFGVSPDLVVGIISGGDKAIRNSVEFAEDDTSQGWLDLKEKGISSMDFLIGLSASGSTPYVEGALIEAKEQGLSTGCIVCNADSRIAELAQYPIEVIVGPEFITGSTRMKSGTAQKMILNMISTSIMIQLGHVEGNRMIDMQLSNEKLWKRGVMMIVEKLGIQENEALALLKEHGSVRRVLGNHGS